jgi:hypothetical protein
MPTIDKAIISNRSALIAKYGQNDVIRIYGKLNDLVVADGQRGVVALVFDIDDPTIMSSVNGQPVSNAGSQQGAKQAVDAIHTHHQCDYILLLDGPDIIPHIDLNQPPGLSDNDLLIPSDLPYASSAPFSNDVSRFFSITRVVGRLPAAHGENSADRLIDLLEKSIAQRSRPVSEFQQFFSMSADVWQLSTQMSLSNVFGGHAGLFLSPPSSHALIDTSLNSRMHFINCHGASGDWRFYGQAGNSYPVAMDSLLVGAQMIAQDALVAAECCYGAELYNYRLLQANQPMCITYLSGGAIAFVGSTTISYGPAAANGMADLICQMFLDRSLKGGSTGRAFLEARQRFVQTQQMSTPQNAKTIAQFNLYGDPSLVPVTRDSLPDGDAVLKSMVNAFTPEDGRVARKARRLSLESNGKSVASSTSRATRKVSERAADSLSAVLRFRQIAAELGNSGTVEVFRIGGGSEFVKSNKFAGGQRRVAVAIEKGTRTLGEGKPDTPFYKVVVGHMLGDGIFKVEEFESK